MAQCRGEKAGLLFKNLCLQTATKHCSGPGLVLNHGELDSFVRDGSGFGHWCNREFCCVSKLEIHGERFCRRQPGGRKKPFWRMRVEAI